MIKSERENFFRLNRAREELPQLVLDILTAVANAGSGVHQYLVRAARYLHHFRTEAEIVELLNAQTALCGREVPDRENQGCGARFQKLRVGSHRLESRGFKRRTCPGIDSAGQNLTPSKN